MWPEIGRKRIPRRGNEKCQGVPEKMRFWAGNLGKAVGDRQDCWKQIDSLRGSRAREVGKAVGRGDDGYRFGYVLDEYGRASSEGGVSATREAKGKVEKSPER